MNADMVDQVIDALADEKTAVMATLAHKISDTARIIQSQCGKGWHGIIADTHSTFPARRFLMCVIIENPSVNRYYFSEASGSLCIQREFYCTTQTPPLPF
ncbi:MAG: hypothetical protein HS132_19285 [Planctomycetia bacterium]|nr:hypothetical protein [Planctomycetia bacterium]